MDGKKVGKELVAKVCAFCGSPFEGIKKAQYCTDACRVAGFRRRQTQRQLAGVA